MKFVQLGNLRVPAVAVGCMGLAALGEKECDAFVSAALQHGLNFFDHADIYGGGKCESARGASLKRPGGARGKIGAS